MIDHVRRKLCINPLCSKHWSACEKQNGPRLLCRRRKLLQLTFQFRLSLLQGGAHERMLARQFPEAICLQNLRLNVRRQLLPSARVPAAFGLAHNLFDFAKFHPPNARQQRPLVGMWIEIGIEKHAVAVAARHVLQRKRNKIDVVYSDLQATRDEALKSISRGLEAARKRLAKVGLEADVSATKDGDEIKLFIRRGRNQVKAEVNHVFRGTVLPVDTRQLGNEARKLFTTELSAPVLATPELYGSKLVAAMDRQHPRDLFDVRGLFERGGLTAEVVECFVCYLAGHNRPVHEVLFSRDVDISSAFENEFAGMARNPITLVELQQVRRKLKRELPIALTASQRKFLLGLPNHDVRRQRLCA